eukprot:g5125.t1
MILERDSTRMHAQGCVRVDDLRGALRHAQSAFVASGRIYGSNHWEVLEESIFLARIHLRLASDSADDTERESHISAHEKSALSFLNHAAGILSSERPHPVAKTGIKCCHVVARLYSELEHYDFADALMRHSATIAQVRYGDASCETAIVFADISVYFVGRGSFASALHFAGRGLVIFLAKRGPTHRSTAEAQYQVALIYRLMAQYGKAQVEFEHARDMFLSLYGSRALETARVDVSLGFVFHMTKRLHQAERCYERALGIREEKLGADHAQTIEVRALLGEVQLKLGRYVYNPAESDRKRMERSLRGINGAVERETNGITFNRFTGLQIQEALEIVSSRTHIPQSVTSELARATKLGPMTSEEVHTIVSALGSAAHQSNPASGGGVYEFLGSAIALQLENSALPTNVLHSILGPDLGHMFGPGGGYGITADRAHTLTYYGNSIARAVKNVNAERTRSGQPKMITGNLLDAIHTVVNNNGGAAMTKSIFLEAVKRTVKSKGGSEAMTEAMSAALDTLGRELERGIPFRGALKELNEQVSERMPDSIGIGGSCSGTLTIGSPTMLKNAIRNVNYGRSTDDRVISDTQQDRLMNTFRVSERLTGGNGSITLRQVMKTAPIAQLGQELASTVKSEFMNLSGISHGDGKESHESRHDLAAAFDQHASFQLFRHIYPNGSHASGDQLRGSGYWRHPRHVHPVGGKTLEKAVEMAVLNNQIFLVLVALMREDLSISSIELGSDSTLCAGTVRRDSLGRRVKVLALTGSELFSLLRPKLFAAGMFVSLKKTIRKRKNRCKLIGLGIFLTVAKASVNRRRALRIAALGLVFRGALERKMQRAGVAIVGVGLFLGLEKHANTISTSGRARRGGRGQKSSALKTKYKQVNFNKEDLVADTENTIFAKQTPKRGRRDSFMALATSDLEADFAKKTRTPKPKKKRADLLPEKDGKKMSMVAFQLTKAHGWDELAEIIEEMDYESLSMEALEALAKPNGACQDIMKYKKKVLAWKPPGKSEGPSSEAELKMLTSAELMVFHLGKVDSLTKRAQSMLYCKSFDENLKPLDTNLNLLMRACREVLSSERLPKIMHYILMLTNHLNQGGRNANISGIRLSGLGKICVTKSGKGQTLLHFMIDKLYVKSPTLLALEDDFPSLVSASVLSSTTMRSDRTSIVDGLKKLVRAIEDAANNDDESYEMKFADFRDRAEVLVDALTEKYDEAMKLYKEACEYLAEDSTKLAFEEYFKLLRSFIDTFKNQRKRAEESREREQKKRKKEDAQKKKMKGGRLKGVMPGASEKTNPMRGIEKGKSLK